MRKGHYFTARCEGCPALLAYVKAMRKASMAREASKTYYARKSQKSILDFVPSPVETPEAPARPPLKCALEEAKLERYNFGRSEEEWTKAYFEECKDFKEAEAAAQLRLAQEAEFIRMYGDCRDYYCLEGGRTRRRVDLPRWADLMREEGSKGGRR